MVVMVVGGEDDGEDEYGDAMLVMTMLIMMMEKIMVTTVMVMTWFSHSVGPRLRGPTCSPVP